MAYTVKEVADYIAANPQLTFAELSTLAQDNGVSNEMLGGAYNVAKRAEAQGSQYQRQYTPSQITTRPVYGRGYDENGNLIFQNDDPTGQQQYTPGQITDQQIKDFFAANPNISNEQTYALMQEYQVSPQQVVNARGLEPGNAYGQYNQQVVNNARPGQVTDYELQAYFANNPNTPDSQVYALMNQYGVSPEQVSRAINMPLDQAQGRYRDARIAATPTGLVGAEEAIGAGLTGATATLTGAQTQSRNDINTALTNANTLLNQNIGGFQQAATTAGNQINTGFDAALGSINQLYGQNVGDLRAAETTANQQVGAGFDQSIETLNRLYGINIDDLRAAAAQASGQINTGFDEARGYFQPYQQGGTQAFNQQMALSGALGRDAFNQARQESPYEQFLFEQGMRGNLAGAAATGGLGGGNVQRELQRFGQGLASQGLQQQIGNLSALSGMGMQGSQALSGLATGRAGALGDISMNTAQNIAGQRGTQAQSVSGMQTQRGGALADIAMNTAQNVAGQRGSQAQSISGLQTGRAGALGDITMNTAGNIAGQRGTMANFAGQAGLNLANIGQNTGQNIAQMQYGTGQDLAAGRTRVGEIQANQLQQAAANQARLLEQLGSTQANMIYDQSGNLIDMGNAAANRAGINAINLSGGISDMQRELAGNISNLQTGLAGNQMQAYQGAARIPSQSFDPEQALGAAAGGYDLYNQLVNAKRPNGLAPVSESVPQRRSYAQTMPNYNVAPQPYQVPGATYNAGLGRFV